MGLLHIVAIVAAFQSVLIGANVGEVDKEVQGAILSFSLNILQKLNENNNQSNNILFSPINIYSALNLLYLGSDGKTKDDLTKGLQLLRQTVDHQKVVKYVQTLGKMIKPVLNVNGPNSKCGTTCEERHASGLFMDKNFPIKPKFLSNLYEYFPSASAKTLDIANSPAEATNEINRWVSNNTNNRIPKLYGQPLDPSTLAVLAASFYFSCKWKEPFRQRFTRNDYFHTSQRDVTVQMMNNVAIIPYHKNDVLKYESIHLPYESENYKVIFVLPYPNQTLHNVIANLKTPDLENLFTLGNNTKVDYKVPKVDFSSSKSLRPVLSQIGLSSIFSHVDLGHMSADKTLRIVDVNHAAGIRVDEEGTVAVAVTSLHVENLSLITLHKDNAVQFYLDRPYMMIIYNSAARTPLFFTIVLDPRN